MTGAVRRFFVFTEHAGKRIFFLSREIVSFLNAFVFIYYLYVFCSTRDRIICVCVCLVFTFMRFYTYFFLSVKISNDRRCTCKCIQCRLAPNSVSRSAKNQSRINKTKRVAFHSACGGHLRNASCIL